MDSKLILEAARGTLDGSLSFPEVVGQLLAAGVEYYHVDYVGLLQDKIKQHLPSKSIAGYFAINSKGLRS
jgi:hypothetical protein